MLILDFRTGRMTKMAFDLGYIPATAIPGAFFGIGGAGLGSLIDMLAGTDRRWTKILGLLGLAGGAGLGGLGLHWYKRENDPKYQLSRFRNQASTPMTEQQVQEIFDYETERIAERQKSITEKAPGDLIRDLVWPTFRDKAGVWSYYPSIGDFQFARYAVSKAQDDTRAKALDLATDIAARGLLLRLYRARIPGDLRPKVAQYFVDYVNESIKQFENPNPDWKVPQSHLDNLVKLLTGTNREDLKELATLIRDLNKVQPSYANV